MKSAIDNIRRCFSLVHKHKAAYFTALVLTVGLGFLSDMMLALLNKNVVNSVTNTDFSFLKTALVFGVVGLAAEIGSLCARYGKMRSIRYMMRDIRCNLFRHMEFLSVGYYEKNHSADSIFRLNSNVENMKRAYTNSFPNIVQGIGGGIGSCVFILTMDLRLGCISLLTCAVTIIVNVAFANPLHEIGVRIQKSESALLSRLSDLIAGFRVIKLYDVDGTVVDRYEETNNSTAKQRIGRVARIGGIDSVSYLLNFINTFVIITIGAVMAAFGMTDFGTVFAILSVQGNVSNMLLDFGNSLGFMQESVAAADMIHEILNNEPEDSVADTSKMSDTSDSYIEFRDVKFAYEEDGDAVLNGINIKIDKGEVVALVGSSGGGKSTAIKLLPEFYRIKGGEIYLCGRNIKSYALHEVRNMISYVPQDAYLFDASIKENIAYGNPGASDDEIVAAAKAANAHTFICDMPSGYDTPVGERGESLSGGQRQRIAIARAFLKDAPILLLDEATSALDTENELVVQSSIEALMKNRTVIVVAHRLSTIENADMIYVLDHGVVAEKGTHNELKNQDGIYRDLSLISSK